MILGGMTKHRREDTETSRKQTMLTVRERERERDLCRFPPNRPPRSVISSEVTDERRHCYPQGELGPLYTRSQGSYVSGPT